MPVPHALSRRIAPQGLTGGFVLLGLAALGLVLAGLGIAPAWVRPVSLFLAVVGLAHAAFFRNPQREIAGDDNTIVSPADGKVVEVVEMEDPSGFVGPGWRVAIFLSIFDVHINRSPVAGKVRGIQRSGSKFLAAFNPHASDLNVQSRMDVETADGLRFSVVQITGLIARRIVGYVTEGETLERGQPYGLICYGSRVEIYLPPSCRPMVKPGDRVRGGASVLATQST